MAQVLPKELRLQAPATMPQARSYMFKQPAVLGQYLEGQTIQINVPRLQRSYLTKDSYLKFQVELVYSNNATTSGTNAADKFRNDSIIWDTPGALGMIDKIEVYDYLGSTLLESTSGHGQLMATLLDFSTDTASFDTHYCTTNDTVAGPVTAMVEMTKGAADPQVGGKAAATGISQQFTQFRQQVPTGGQVMMNNALSTATPHTAGNTQTIYAEYSLPLFSFLGSLSTKYAPLHNGFTIMITLNTWATALGHYLLASNVATPVFATYSEAAITNYTPTNRINTGTSLVKNVNLCCQILELGPVAESMLLSSTGGQPLTIPTKAYRNYVGTIPAGTSTYRLDLNLNVASLTNLLFIQRHSAYVTGTNNFAAKSLSGRARNYLQNWNFQYGSSILPQTTGISCRGRPGQADAEAAVYFQEAYVELLKSRHLYNDSKHSCVITPESFTLDTYPNTNWVLSLYNTTTRGTFACGLDLELVSGRSNDLICGMNTNGMNTSIELNFDSTQSPIASRLDCWCEYDAFINISPGIATTVSF